MSWMQALNGNKPLATAGLLVVIVGAVVMIVRQGMPGAARVSDRVNYGYYYHLDTGALTVDKASMRSSMDEGKVVRARVYSCGDCPDGDSRFIGWLETFSNDSPEAELVVAAEPTEGGAIVWAPMDSDAGVGVMDFVQRKCVGAGRPATACAPFDWELP